MENNIIIKEDIVSALIITPFTVAFIATLVWWWIGDVQLERKMVEIAEQLIEEEV